MRNVSLASGPSCPTVSFLVYQPKRDGISVSSPDIDRVYLYDISAPAGLVLLFGKDHGREDAIRLDLASCHHHGRRMRNQRLVLVQDLAAVSEARCGSGQEKERIYTPAPPDRPAASVRDFGSGAYTGAGMNDRRL
jgi:hypothetical protein